MSYATTIGDKIDEKVQAAGRRRKQKQLYNELQAARKGVERVVNVGDYVFIENTNGQQSDKFANKQQQSGPFKVVEVDWRRRRVLLRRVADGKRYLRWTSINRIQTVSKEAVETKIDGAWAGEKDASLLLDRAKAQVATKQQKDDEKQQAQQERQREQAAREAAREAARKAEEQRREAIDRRLDEEQAHVAARKQHRATVDIPEGAEVAGRRYTADSGEVIVVKTATAGELEISKEHRRYRQLAAELAAKKAKQEAINKKNYAAKLSQDRRIRAMRRQATRK